MNLFSHQATQNITVFFKLTEWFFWAAQLWLVTNLISPRAAFNSNLRCINFLIRCQGFDSQLAYTEKAFKIWRRDLWILMFLNPLIIIFIHLI